MVNQAPLSNTSRASGQSLAKRADLTDPRARPDFRRRLLAWFQQHQRDLPWRKDRDPYRIWVSEVMLQQTQVATVVPYFERFLDRFPTLTDLAAADEQDVLRLWEGLGYYRRARDLHGAARELVARHGERLPDDPVALASLPGMGRYTLGALLSQAFDRRLPILEANSQRVLCRLFGQAGDPRRGPTRRWLWEMAEALLPSRRAGDFNQAIMELGALVCTPSAPRCESCPIARYCVARRKGLQEHIPLKPAPPEAVDVPEVAIVVRRRNKVFLVQRPGQGRWANLWEFPRGPVQDGEDTDQAGRRILRDLTGMEAELGMELLTIRHGVTRFRITLVCLESRYLSGRFASNYYQQGRWLLPARLHEFPVSVPQRRLAQALIAGNRQPHLF